MRTAKSRPGPSKRANERAVEGKRPTIVEGVCEVVRRVARSRVSGSWTRARDWSMGLCP